MQTYRKHIHPRNWKKDSSYYEDEVRELSSQKSSFTKRQMRHKKLSPLLKITH